MSVRSAPGPEHATPDPSTQGVSIQDRPTPRPSGEPPPILPGLEAPINGPLTASHVDQACRFLSAQSSRLRALSNAQVIAELARVARRWLEPGYPLRLEAIERLEASTGFSRPVVAWGLDALFSAWDETGMMGLLEHELGDPRVLERLTPRAGSPVLSRAIGPRLVAHVLAGNVPPPAVQSLFAGLLARAPGFVKASSRAQWFPHLLVRSIEEESPLLRGCVACAAWPGGDAQLETALFGSAEVVVAYGSNETLASIRARVLPPRRLVGRGQRVSVAYVARECLRPGKVSALARALATDVAVYDQAGCLSPHVILVERHGEIDPGAFAQLLAEEAFPAVQLELPAGRMELEQAAAAMQLKGVHAFTGRVWEGEGYAVVWTSSARFEPSCLGRVILVRAVEGVGEAGDYLLPVADLLQGVALAGEGARREALAEELALLGAGRICAPGSMQSPPAAWGGDGRPLVGELVRWSSLEPPG